MKIKYTGEYDYMAKIRNGDVFDVISFTNNEYGKTIYYEIENIAGETVFLDESECVILVEDRK